MNKFICPIENAIITSDYGMRLHPKSHKYEKHPAIDIQNASRTKAPVYSSYQGVVTKVVKDHDSYGNYITITHKANSRKYVTLYAHLDSISIKLDQKVSTGEQIGIMGRTGTATGIHLHFEIHNSAYAYDNGQYLNSLDPKGFIDLAYSKSSFDKDNSKEVKPPTTPAPPPVAPKSDDDKAWEWAVEEQLIRDGNPSNNVTRKQLAIVLHRFYNKFVKERK